MRRLQRWPAVSGKYVSIHHPQIGQTLAGFDGPEPSEWFAEGVKVRDPGSLAW